MRDREKNKLAVNVILAVGLVAITGICVLAVHGFVDLRSHVQISKNTFRDRLGMRIHSMSVKPSVAPFQVSELVHDAVLSRTGLYKLQLPDSGFMSTWTWRVMVPGSAEIVLSTAKQARISIVNNEGVIRGYARKGNIRQVLSPGSYRIRLDGKLAGIRTLDLKVLRVDSNRIPAPGMKMISIQIPGPAWMKLENMITSARKSFDRPEGGSVPSNRVEGYLETGKGSSSRIKIGLSGRTRMHFYERPSLHVNVTSGRLYRGMSAFKLYTISTKSGIMDFVFRSVMKDMGFLAPRQDLVHMFVNGKDLGPYYLEETYSSEMLDSFRKGSGLILGYHPGELSVTDPRRMQFKNKLFRTGWRDEKVKAGTMPPISGPEYTKHMDPEVFSFFLAFCSVYMCTHGLGIDDLRFLMEPVTGRYHPIARDLNPGAWHVSEVGPLRSAVANILWWTSRKVFSGFPLLHLRDMKPGLKAYPHDIWYRIEESVGLWDVHPAVLDFTRSRKNFEKIQRKTLFLFQDKIIAARLQNRALNLERLHILNLDPSSKFQFKFVKKLGIKRSPKVIMGTLARPFLGMIKGNNWIQLINLNTFPVRIPLQGREVQLSEARYVPYIGDYSSKEKLSYALVLERAIDTQLKIPGRRSTVFAKMQNADGVIAGLKKAGFRLVSSGLEEIIPPGTQVPLNKAVIAGTGVLDSDHDTYRIGYIVRNLKKKLPEGLFKIEMFDRETIYPENVFSVKMPGKRNKNETLENRHLINRELLPGELVTFLTFRIRKKAVPRKFSLTGSDQFKVYDVEQNVVPAGTKSKKEPVNWKNYFIMRHGSLFPSRNPLHIQSDLSTPQGVGVVLKEGQRVHIESGACLLIPGGLTVKGSEKSPVMIGPAQGREKGGGFVVDAGKRQVSVKHAMFSRLGRFRNGDACLGRTLTGAVSIMNADVEMDHVDIRESVSEDGLHIYNSDFVIRKLAVSGSSSDALDVDYGRGVISESVFTDNKQDGVDFSYSVGRVFKSIFRNNGDKAVSVGESSNVSVEGGRVLGSETGIAVKDSSFVRISGVSIEKNRYGVAEYIKKPQFARGTLILGQNRFSQNGKDRVDLGYYPYRKSE